jgi:hypothetical protein
MPAQVGFSGDTAAERRDCGGSNNANEDEFRFRNDGVPRHRQQRVTCCDDVTSGSRSSISCGNRIGRPTLGNWASAMTSTTTMLTPLSSAFRDMSPPVFPVFPLYRTVGTQTDGDDEGHVCDDDDDRRFLSCDEDVVGDSQTDFNSPNCSMEAKDSDLFGHYYEELYASMK